MNPYIHNDGRLVIPFDSDPKFHWWSHGQRPEITMEELRNDNNMDTNSPSNSVDSVVNVVILDTERDVPFSGAYGVSKKDADSRGNGQGANLAGDNLLLF